MSYISRSITELVYKDLTGEASSQIFLTDRPGKGDRCA